MAPDSPHDPRMRRFVSRLAERLAAAKLSARGASLKAGLDEDYVRNIERGMNRNPRLWDVLALAEAAETSLLYLAGLSDLPGPLREEAGRLVLTARLAVGVWVDENRAAAGRVELAPLSAAEEWGAPQFAALMKDESMARAGLPAGAFLHCVDAAGAGYAPAEGDLVTIKRVRRIEQAALVERTARRIEAGPAGLILATCPADPAAREEAPLMGPDGARGADIDGLVIAALVPAALLKAS